MSTRQAIKKTFLKAVVLLALVTTPAYANMVTNGGFETTGDKIQVHTNVPSDPDTVGLWKFDETSGTTATNAQGDAANDGTLINFNGTADSGSTNTLTDTVLSTNAGSYVGTILEMTGGANNGLTRDVTGYDGVTQTITCDAFPNAIAAGDTYIVGWTASGKSNGALVFDGSNDYVNCGHDASLNVTNLTVEGWVYATSSKTWQGILTKQKDGGWQDWDVKWVLGTNPRFSIGTSGVDSLSSPNNYSKNTWHHFVAIRNTATWKIQLYINGEFDCEKDETWKGAFRANYDFWIGCTYISGGVPTRWFNGTIDEVRISNVARICPANWNVDTNLTGNLYNGCLYQARDQKHSGTYSLKMNPTAGTSTVFSTRSDTITVTKGAVYNVSGWIRTDTAYNGDTEPQIVAVSGGNTCILTGGGEATHDTWRHYKGSIQAGSTNLTITLKAYGTAGSCWFDGICLDMTAGTVFSIY